MQILSSFKKHKRKIIALLIVLLLISGSIRIFASRNSQGVPVVSGKVIESNFEQAVFATGTLEVKGKQDVFAKISNTVEEILVEPGTKVKTGQVLVRLDNEDLALRVAEQRAVYDAKKTELIRIQANLRKAEKEYELAKKNYERSKELKNIGAFSQQKYEEDEMYYLTNKEDLQIIREATLPLMQAEMEEAKAVYEQAQRELNLSNIISPIDGTLLSLNVKENHPVQRGELIATVGDVTNLEIETGINEVDAADLKVGDKVEITSEGLLETTFIGHIEYVAPIAELEMTSQGEQTQVKIRVAVDDVNNSVLKPGYNVNLKVILSQKEKAILVPYEAVTQRDSQDVVFIVDKEGKVEERPITLGLSNALFFEVLSGLQKDENVILNPNEQIKHGIKVKVND